MTKENVLIIGSGGREHALAWAVSKSPAVEKVICSPGNAGMAQLGQCVELDLKKQDSVSRFISENKIKLAIIGPEAPLVDGLADYLRSEGHLVLGAGRIAAQLEGSKIFAKNFMAKYGIPTAPFRVFDDPRKAKDFALSKEGERFLVLKADGLAAGKGVLVAETPEDIVTGITQMMEEKKFGAAGEKIILEEKVNGPEISVIALTDGKTVLPFPASQDHKRVFDGDRGPNTGGMGAYAPTPFYDDQIKLQVEKLVIENFLKGLAAEGIEFRGIIYFGLMATFQGIRVLEFNVRMGDPEAQVVLPLIKSDLYEAFLAVAEGRLSGVQFEHRPGAACTVVMASGGYPGDFSKGFCIFGLEDVEKAGQVYVFQAGTKKGDQGIMTSGGRVLAITGLAGDLSKAVVRAYQGVKKIWFQEVHYRNDIAAKALKNSSIYDKIKKMKPRYAKEFAISKN